jgi:hypothetical protein
MAYTRKATFAEMSGFGEPHHFMRATDMQASESAMEMSHETADLARFVVFDSPDDALSADVIFPGSGYFEFFVAGGPLGDACSASVNLRIDGQLPRTIGLESAACDSSFTWGSPGGYVWVTEGSHHVSLEMAGQAAGVDALVLQWKPFDQPCQPPDCAWTCGVVENACSGLVDCGPCWWSDPEGDTLIASGDLTAGVAAFSDDVIDFRLRLAGNPYPALLRHEVQLCLDMDLRADTGTACPSGIQGGDVAVVATLEPGAMGPQDMNLVVRDRNGVEDLPPCDYDTFDPQTNTLRLLMPFDTVGEVDGKLRYVVTSTAFTPMAPFEDSAPDAPGFQTTSGSLRSVALELEDIPGLTCGWWSDPTGDTPIPAGDLTIGVAACADDVIDFRVRLAESPYPAAIHHELEWCLDVDMRADTGAACSSGLQGGDVAIIATLEPGAHGPQDLDLAVRSDSGVVNLWPCDYDTFDPQTNTIRLVMPFGMVGEDDGRLRYVVTATSVTVSRDYVDSAPDVPDFDTAGGSFAGFRGRLGDMPGLTCQ